MPSDSTRRTALRPAAGAAPIPRLGLRPARALDAGSAQRLVTRPVDDIDALIRSARSKDAMYRDVARPFDRHGDVPTIARVTLRTDGRRARPAQRRRCDDAYRSRIARVHAGRFRECIGGRSEVTGTRALPRDRRTDDAVPTAVCLCGEDPFEMSCRVSDASGAAKPRNLPVEGVTMLLPDRSGIGAMRDWRGGAPEATIREIGGG